MLGVASCKIQALGNGMYPESTYWHPFGIKAITVWSLPQSDNERQQSVNDFVGCIFFNRKAVPQHLSIMEVLAAFTGNIVCVDTATPPNEFQQSVN
jgi:hypothetical protein